MITSEDIIDHIGKMQAVSVEHLNKVSCMPEPKEQLNWARRFFRVKQCFSNALQMSIVTECDLVVGYVFLPEFGICIEHAWNAHLFGNHFDLTAQLFWNAERSAEYFQLLRLSSEESLVFYQERKGVDHMALRRMPKYQHLFKINMI